MALVRSFNGVIVTESLLLQPDRLIVTMYFIGTVGNTTGVAVLTPLIFVAGDQLNIPPAVPVAVSCRLSSAQMVVSFGKTDTAGVASTVTLWLTVSLQPLLLPEIN